MILVESPAGRKQELQSSSQNLETKKLSGEPNLNLQESEVRSSPKAKTTAMVNVKQQISTFENSLSNTDTLAETAISTCEKGVFSDTSQFSKPASIELPNQIPSQFLTHENVPKDAWPRWFWPGVGAAILAGMLIFTVRFILHSDESTVSNATVQPVSTEKSNVNPAADLEVEPSHDLMGSRMSTSDTSSQVIATDSNSLDKPYSLQSAPNSNSSTNTTKADTRTLALPSSTTPNQTVAAVSDVVNTAPQKAAVTSDKEALPTANASGTVAPIASEVSSEKQINIGTLKRVSPKFVNINARLSDSLPNIELQRQPLVDFLALISSASTIPITIDAEALKQLGQSAAAPISLHLNDANISQILQTSLETLGLGYQIYDGQLIVGYSPQEKLRQVRYVVTDLIGGNGPPLNDFASLIKQLIVPTSWQAGGKATMVANNGVLLVEQTESAHSQILDFCERLRVARGLPLKSSYDPARFLLNSREKQALELLNKPITVNFSQPRPLGEVINWLRNATGALILINHAALAQDGISDESECTAHVVNAPLQNFLDELTSSADLCWRVIDGQTIEITTHQAALEHMDVEFYPVRDLLAVDNLQSQKLMTQIKSEVEPKLWNNQTNNLTSKNTTDKATIYFDMPSSTFIVRAPQRLQAQVEAALAAAKK